MSLQCKMVHMLTPAVDMEVAMCCFWREQGYLGSRQWTPWAHDREAKSVLVRGLQVHSVFCHARQTARGSFHDWFVETVSHDTEANKSWLIRGFQFTPPSKVAGNIGPEIWDSGRWPVKGTPAPLLCGRALKKFQDRAGHWQDATLTLHRSLTLSFFPVSLSSSIVWTVLFQFVYLETFSQYHPELLFRKVTNFIKYCLWETITNKKNGNNQKKF